MSRGISTFRQRDVSAAIKAAKDAGLSVSRVIVSKDGTISVIAGKPETTDSMTDKTDQGNEWDA